MEVEFNIHGLDDEIGVAKAKFKWTIVIIMIFNIDFFLLVFVVWIADANSPDFLTHKDNFCICENLSILCSLDKIKHKLLCLN